MNLHGIPLRDFVPTAGTSQIKRRRLALAGDGDAISDAAPVPALEVQFESRLHDPGIANAQDLPKIRTIRLNVVRNSRLRMVKDVEGRGPELQFPAFRKPKILLHRRIHIIRPGTTEIRLTHYRIIVSSGPLTA